MSSDDAKVSRSADKSVRGYCEVSAVPGRNIIIHVRTYSHTLEAEAGLFRDRTVQVCDALGADLLCYVMLGPSVELKTINTGFQDPP